MPVLVGFGTDRAQFASNAVYLFNFPFNALNMGITALYVDLTKSFEYNKHVDNNIF
jgi:hypothetical protein